VLSLNHFTLFKNNSFYNFRISCCPKDGITKKGRCLKSLPGVAYQSIEKGVRGGQERGARKGSKKMHGSGGGGLRIPDTKPSISETCGDSVSEIRGPNIHI
jgi:hypothetical protein